jgi:cytochrome P450
MLWSTEYAAAITIILPLAAASLLVVLFFKIKYRNGDDYPPVAATMVDHMLNFKRLHDFLYDHHRRLKTFRIAYPNFTLVSTTDPANVEHIVKSNFANYVKGTYVHGVMEDLFGDGILNVDGEQWRQQRKLSGLEFSAKILRDFSGVVFRENAIKLSRILLETYRTNQSAEMQGLFLRSTMDAICKLGFGIETNSLSITNSGPEASFANALETADSTIFKRYFDPTWKLKRYFNIGSEAIIKESIKTVDDFIANIIQTKRREISLQNNNVKPDLLSRFMAVTEKNPENYSDKYLRDIVINFMLAGRDTVAITLSWFFHLLCQNPDVEKKILQEIHDVVKANKNEGLSVEESISMFSESLTHAVVDKMQYLHAALTETLRLYPPLAVEGKCAISDDTLPDGYKIKKGQMVSYVPYSMGRMKYLWGADANEFRPERWLNQNGVFQPQSPFKFTAFTAGPRICLGKEFAYRQMKTVAAVLIRFFKFEGGQHARYRPALLLFMSEDGLNLRVKPRCDR